MNLFTDFQFFSGLLVISLLFFFSYNNSSSNKLNTQKPNPRQQIQRQRQTGIFQIPTNPPNFTIPELIPIKTQGSRSEFVYRKVGSVYTEDPTEDTIYLLEGRHHPYNRNDWQYRVLTTSGSTIGNYSIPIYLNNGDSMKELYTGDAVSIKGKESLGNFIVEIDDPDPLFRF